MKFTTPSLVGAFAMAFAFHNASAQCDEQVTTLSGTQVLGSTTVTVSSSGMVDENTSYCLSTFPYFIGYTYGLGSSGTGSYTFVFDPPIDSATLNISGLSRDALNAEEVWLYVDGSFYAIEEPGDPQSCDALCELTPYGAIAACSGCSVSGWGNTRIAGPITTLTVEDTVFLGQPAGGIFSLFVCAGTSGLHEAADAGQGRPYPNPASDALWIDLPDARSATVQLFDANGRTAAANTTRMDNRLHISTEGLAPGVYAVRVEQGTRRTMHRVVVE